MPLIQPLANPELNGREYPELQYNHSIIPHFCFFQCLWPIKLSFNLSSQGLSFKMISPHQCAALYSEFFCFVFLVFVCVCFSFTIFAVIPVFSWRCHRNPVLIARVYFFKAWLAYTQAMSNAAWHCSDLEQLTQTGSRCNEPKQQHSSLISHSAQEHYVGKDPKALWDLRGTELLDWLRMSAMDMYWILTT